jgi:hypothetical protein
MKFETPPAFTASCSRSGPTRSSWPPTMTSLSAREPARGEVAVRRYYALEHGEVDVGYALTRRSPPVSDEITVGYST